MNRSHLINGLVKIAESISNTVSKVRDKADVQPTKRNNITVGHQDVDESLNKINKKQGRLSHLKDNRLLEND